MRSSIGTCFVDVSEEMTIVYGKYCRNHDEAIAFLEKVKGKLYLSFRDRSLFMAGVGPEEKTFLNKKIFLPNPLQNKNIFNPTFQMQGEKSTPPCSHFVR